MGALINDSHLEVIVAKFKHIKDMLDNNNLEIIYNNIDFINALFDTNFYQTTKLGYFSNNTKCSRFCNSKLKSIMDGYTKDSKDSKDATLCSYISTIDKNNIHFILCILDLYTQSNNEYGDNLDMRYIYELYIYYEIFNVENQTQSTVKPRREQSTVKPRPNSAVVIPNSHRLPLVRSVSAHYGGGNKYGDKCAVNNYCGTLVNIINEANKLTIPNISTTDVSLYQIRNTHGTCNAVAYMTCVINTFKALQIRDLQINNDKFVDSCLSKLLYKLLTGADQKFEILDAILYSKNFQHKFGGGRNFNVFKNMFSTQVTPINQQHNECSEKINPVGPISFIFHETFNSIVKDICRDNVIIVYSKSKSKTDQLTATKTERGIIYDLIAFTVDNYNIRCFGHIFAIFKAASESNGDTWQSHEAIINDQEINDMLESDNECDDILHTKNNGLRYNIKKSDYYIGFYVKRIEQQKPQSKAILVRTVVSTAPKPGIINILGYRSDDLYYAKLKELKKTLELNVLYKSFYNEQLTFLGLISIIVKVKIHKNFTPDTFAKNIMKYIDLNIKYYNELYIFGEGYGGLVASQILLKFYSQGNLPTSLLELDVSTYGSLYVPNIEDNIENITYRHFIASSDEKYAYIEKGACVEERCKPKNRTKYLTNQDISDIINMYTPHHGGKHNNSSFMIYYKIKINKQNKQKYITYKRKARYLSDMRGKYRYTNDSTIYLCKTH
jgi:hypothetical protein